MSPNSVNYNTQQMKQSQAPVNILVIPHQPHRGIKVRALEMATYLAEFNHFNVFVLTWELSPVPSKNMVEKIFSKGIEALKTINTSFGTESQGVFQWVRIPHLLAPYPYCQSFNKKQVKTAIDELEIDVVINANAYHFPVPHCDNLTYYYDVVDDHLSEGAGPIWKRTKEFTLNELSKADQILTISHALQDVMAKIGFTQSTRIANGVDVESILEPTEEQIESIRKKYNLGTKKCIAYIGNHGWWAGMEFMIKVFQRVQEKYPEVALLIVGPGEDIPEYQPQYENDSIIFTGPVPPTEVAAYFNLSEFGVLPFDLCPFTHHALPLKVLEYGAAKKRVFSSKLQELITLGLPHIELLELEIDIWADRLLDELESPRSWMPEWDSVIRQYDWGTLFKPLVRLIEETELEAKERLVRVEKTII